ncbi:MAG: hypothetical protein Q4A97_11430, partial [Comamonadaceae bacterium]|nr:hypothetical protein [Comamonadaceae bacterium]
MGWRRLFGRTLADMGIEGTFGGEAGFEGRQYQFYRGGVFRSDRRRTSEIDESTRSLLGGAFNDMRAQVAQFADAIGLEANRLRDYTSSFSLSTKGMNEEQIREALMNAMRSAGDAMAQSILGQDNPFIRAGESSIDALERLAGSLLAANKIFDTLGHTLYEASIAGGDMASQLVDLFGGREAMQSAARDYLDRYYSDKERSEIAMRQMSEAFGELGFAMPESLVAMRQLIEAQDLTTEAGRRHYASLMQLSAAYADAQQLAAQVADAERERAAAIVQEQQQKIAGLYATAEISAEAIAKSLRDGMLGRIGSDDLGAQLAEQIIGGIHNSLASGFAQQITDLFTGQIITPVLQAAAAGATASAAVSQAAIDSVVAQAQSSMAALQAIINDAGFQSLLAQVREAVGGVAGAVGTAPKTTTALAGGMGGMAAATERATGATKQHTDAQAQHASLLRELYRLEGRFAELRQLELQQIDPANRAMQQRIWLLEREQAIAAKLYELDSQMLQLQGDTAALRERQLQEMIRSFDRYALAGTGAAGALGDAAKELTRVQQLAKYGQDSAGFISQLRPEDRRSMFEAGGEAFLRQALDEAMRSAASGVHQMLGQALARGDVSEARYEFEYQQILDRHLDQLDMGIAQAIADGHEASALRALEMVNSIRGREGALRDGRFDGGTYSSGPNDSITTLNMWEAMFGKGHRLGSGTLEQLNAFTRLNALRGNEGLFAVDDSRVVRQQAEQTIQQQRYRLKELEAQIAKHQAGTQHHGVAGEADLARARHHAAQVEALQAQADGIRQIIAEQEKKVQDAIQADLDALIKRQKELWAAQDAAAVKAERDGLWKQWLQAIGDQGALRDLERAALNEANRALFDQINAQVDLNKARGEYEGLWKQWLQLTDEAAAREIERAALLSDTSRALYDQIHAYRELKGAVESATGAISSEIERLLGV